ncbi:MAG: hypothetical protein LBQ41_00645 [Candidatus Ancillula sp.]|nr:hypothetical protein [Candidatus Ancillula sp.]
MVRPGYYDTKKIADLINRELIDNDPDEEKLNLILRALPKIIYDWNDLSDEEILEITKDEPEIKDERWRALVEGLVSIFYHTQLWKTPPKWTKKTTLKEPFYPRAMKENIGKLWISRIFKKTPMDFREKNVLFASNEMMLI